MMRINSFKQVLIHLLFIIILAVAIIMVFFFVFLPKTTNHSETQTVPDLIGVNYEELQGYLTQRNLRYEVLTDSSYSSEYPPNAVLKQNPKSGSRVKENRKIYVSLNAENPPKVKMPNLIDGSVKSAQMVLESYGLILGRIEYKPDLAQNAVLEQRYNGEKIDEGRSIHKGSKIDLVVGDGLGKQTFPVPSVLTMDLESAEFLIIGSNLQVGNILEVQDEDYAPGTIIRQEPPAGGNIRVGEMVDLWVAVGDPEEDGQQGEEKKKEESVFQEMDTRNNREE